MNILFTTIVKINDISDRGVYTDLMRRFIIEGHNVYILTPLERRYKQKTTLINRNNLSILKIRTLNIQKINLLEKYIALSLIKSQFLNGIKKYFSDIDFDLVIYSTPPITFLGLVEYIKRRDGAASYLLLKDIFPQNAVDLGMIRKDSLIHNYLGRREKKLYRISDFIGCMSQSNVNYLLQNNPEINPDKVEINPNSHELFEEPLTKEQTQAVRKKYKIPSKDIVFIYGGNLGKPQGINFVLDFLDSQMGRAGVFFIIVGSGTEYEKIKSWFELKKPSNAALLSELPKNEYNLLLKSCDVGMIFLDRRFTVPNFPSRLLSYMEYKIPVIAATDINTDLGTIIVKNNFGLWSEAGDIIGLDENVSILSENENVRQTMGQNAYNYFKNNYTVKHSYDIIMKHFKAIY